MVQHMMCHGEPAASCAPAPGCAAQRAALSTVPALPALSAVSAVPALSGERLLCACALRLRAGTGTRGAKPCTGARGAAPAARCLIEQQQLQHLAAVVLASPPPAPAPSTTLLR